MRIRFICGISPMADICSYRILSSVQIKDVISHLSESEWALLARYVYTYKEFIIVTEAPQSNRMTGQDTDNKRTIYK